MLSRVRAMSADKGTRNAEKGTRNAEKGTSNADKGTSNADKGTINVIQRTIMPRACEYSPNCRCTADSCQTADRLSLHHTLLTHPLRRLGSPLAPMYTPVTSAPGLGSPLSHLRRDWAHPCHICTGTGLAPATSALGLGSPLPHLHWDWAHPRHICARTGLTPATSAPGPGLDSPRVLWPHLHRDW
jgi:hypothetical protein